MEMMYNTKKKFDIFPASQSNQISYLYFCTLGGLQDPRCSKIEHRNGTYIYYTYHLISVA